MFQDTFVVLKWSFINSVSVCMNIPLRNRTLRKAVVQNFFKKKLLKNSGKLSGI